jgi:uncharacterized membrane protein
MRDGTALARPFGAAFVLGFALSGFFDGVLLHQILQWHHLLSLVEAEAVRSLHAQILADGLFHALMYGVAVVGLVMLWRARAGLAAAGGSRRLASGVLIGFGTWNVVDVGLFHWILEIHHIRLDVANPVAWDAGWLLVLGLVPLAAGLALMRSRRPGAPGGAMPARVLLLMLLVSGGWNLRPPPANADILVVFQPGADILTAVATVDARIVDLKPEQSLAVLRLPNAASAWRLYRHGAILVQGAGPSGCFNWARTPAATKQV